MSADSGERPDPTEAAPRSAGKIDDYSSLDSLDFGGPVEIGLAVWDEQDGWLLLDKVTGEPDALGTLIKGANGHTYFRPLIDPTKPYERNEPVPIDCTPYRLQDHWVQYLARQVNTLPNGRPATQFQPRPPRKTGGWL